MDHAPPAHRPSPPSLPRKFVLTPSVALRSLTSQMQEFEKLLRGLPAGTPPPSLHASFLYPLSPPRRHVTRPIGDPVLHAISEYATKVLARQGLLGTTQQVHIPPTASASTATLASSPTSASSASFEPQGNAVARHTQLTRELFVFEHALAMGLRSLYPHAPLYTRENAARCTLSTAAYWCHMRELIVVPQGFSHPLLGGRPMDPPAQALFDHAVDAFDAPHDLVVLQDPTSDIIDLRDATRSRVHVRIIPTVASTSTSLDGPTLSRGPVISRG